MSGLVLTGFMGTGKTTVGRRLAHIYGLPLIDLDHTIEARVGLPVGQIFDTQGEGAFRDLETEALREALAEDGEAVISTGGGALVRDENRALLGACPTVCLVCDPKELRQRLACDSRRPLLAHGGGDAIERLLAERAAIYAAFPQVDTTGRVPDDVADEVARLVGLGRAGTLQFERAARSHLHFGRGLVHEIGPLLAGDEVTGQVMVVTDATVDRLGPAESVAQSLRLSGFAVHVATLPPGEGSKSMSSLAHLYALCMEAHLERGDTIVAVGGGVICDLAGFLAATYLRGLRLLSVPTTLLAQVDAAIGGKVGVDVEGSKNLVGAFYPAAKVLIDPDVLKSLPVRLLSHGLVEMVKIAAVRSSRLLDALDDLPTADTVLRHPDLIRWAAREKIAVVADDPYERQPGGDTVEDDVPPVRALLNFGHTVGHALEAASDYRLTHGEAVGIGMVAETRMAAAAGYCPPELAARLEAILERLGVPTVAPHMPEEELMGHLYHDKKTVGGTLRFALPTGAGSGGVFRIPDHMARRALRDGMRAPR